MNLETRLTPDEIKSMLGLEQSTQRAASSPKPTAALSLRIPAQALPKA